jgi:hypothetical protein
MRAVFASVVLVCAGVTPAADASVATIRTPRRPACKVVATSTLSTILGHKATRAAGQGLSGYHFQLTTGPGGGPLRVSLCSWTYGTPASDVTPIVTIQYFAAAARTAARTEYNAIKAGMAPVWHSLRGIGDAAASESGQSGQSFAATAIARRRNQILEVDIGLPSEKASARSLAVAILRRSVRNVWPNR